MNLEPLEAGRYQLIEVIGTGGMATVYRAWDERLQVTRAIKVLLPQLAQNTAVRKRFETEARTMARLYHRNIVGVHDVGVDGDRVYIVMELVAGGSLMDHLTAHGPMPVKLAAECVLSLLEALKAAHGKNVVHRDIKPHNIMVDHEGVLKVGDFGIAHVGDENRSMTKTGSIMGTWGYMAPEQRASSRDVDFRADLYSAAASWFTLLTNQLPSDLFAVDLDETMLEPVPEVARDLLKKATRYKVEERFQDCDSMIAAFQALVTTLPEEDCAYPVPGADIDDQVLSAGRRGATIVPHSDSSELRSSAGSAPTYAGGVISHKISQNSGGQPASQMADGTLYVADLPDVTENEPKRTTGRFFGAVVAVLAVVVLSYVLLQKSKDDGGVSEENAVQQEVASSANSSVSTPTPTGVMDAESIELARGAAWDIPGDAPQDLESTRKELEQKVEDLKQAEPSMGKKGETVEPDPTPDVPVVIEETPVDIKLPPKPSMTFRVDVSGVEHVETLYLVSKTSKKTYQRPFRTLPSGTYTLYYRWKGHTDTLKDPKPLVLAEGGGIPSIACKPGFEVCRIQSGSR